MPRNIVLCCDGSGNELFGNKTNVLRLYYALERSFAQRAFYHPGVGTLPFASRWARLYSLAFGKGIHADISSLYSFLVREYQPGDNIYLFGFSRGAFAVRAVASVIHMYGVLQPENENLTPYLIASLASMSASARSEEAGLQARQLFEEAHDVTGAIGRRTQVRFVGVWDTVQAVGSIWTPWSLPYIVNNPSIDIGRHALAIDERRAMFRPVLWGARAHASSASGPADLKQVWFRGVHSDVGGGYPEAESGLAKLSFEWMLNEAVMAGLRVDHQVAIMALGANTGGLARPDPDAPAHESLDGQWRLAEWLPRSEFDFARGRNVIRMNRQRRRTIPAGSLVHSSAVERCREWLPQDAVIVYSPALLSPPPEFGAEQANVSAS